MIVATAGHVDHGKTLLVKALTGVDTDRLGEEKRRGVTIEPGFAYLRGPGDVVLGFVDVPGHERFVANMLAGVASIDFVLLVVAVDDGVMPQTIEHVAILDLLGIERGIVVLTKIDRAGTGRAAEVEAAAVRLLDDTSLAGSPVHRVSAANGLGIDALRSALFAEATRRRQAPAAGRFRLSIDRSFHRTGAGLVVTGAVVSGAANIGDHLVLSPSGRRIRIRDMRVSGEPVRGARAGDRAALNITGDGLERQHAPRGAWVLDEALHAPTRTLDASFRLLPCVAKPITHWLPVHVHLGACHVTGHLALLGDEPIAPGSEGFVELILNEPISALSGDRFIVRDQSATRTIGGGRVVDPFPPPRGRTRPQRRTIAAALSNPDAAVAFRSLLECTSREIHLGRFALARNLDDEEAERLYAEAGVIRFSAGGAAFGFVAARWHELHDRLLAVLADVHRQAPQQRGVRRNDVGRLVDFRESAIVLEALLENLLSRKRIARTGPWLHLPGHRPVLGAADAATWRRMEDAIQRDGLRAPSVGTLAESLEMDPGELAGTLRRFEDLGLLVAVARNRFLTLRQMAGLAGIAERLAKSEGAETTGFTASTFKDASGTGRNLTIEALEYFDRIGLTRRHGAYRRVLRSGGDVFSEYL
ncbi:MAG: selenocysteine-specific translation elongation factor [Burkholderiaceae bacterium]|nr:selenocysteine-specific translation elongation factor [Burkholderiaceae bacterium]